MQEIFTHPNYNDSTKKHDVALVELTEDIKWTANIKPACLNTDTHDLGPEVKLTLTGWGIKDPWSKGMHSLPQNLVINNFLFRFVFVFHLEKVESNALLKTTLITTPLSRCNETYSTSSLPEEEARLAVLIDGQYCAIDPTVLEEGEMAAGPCRDNGAPLQFIPDNSRIARIVGISSYGIACGNHLPAVFTRVAYYLNWIESIVWPESRYSFEIAIDLLNSNIIETSSFSPGPRVTKQSWIFALFSTQQKGRRGSLAFQ